MHLFFIISFKSTAPLPLAANCVRHLFPRLKIFISIGYSVKKREKQNSLLHTSLARRADSRETCSFNPTQVHYRDILSEAADDCNDQTKRQRRQSQQQCAGHCPLSTPSGTRRRQECEACENYRLAASRHRQAASVSCPQLLHHH